MIETLKQIGEIYGLVLIFLMMMGIVWLIFFLIYEEGKELYRLQELNIQIYENNCTNSSSSIEI